MPDFSKHADVLELLQQAQDADHDNREHSRDAHLFINKIDGQWEPYWWDLNSDKPRYTFDLTSPVVDRIAGDMEKADFDIKVKPAGGEATKDIALLFDGLIRNIENISNAVHVFNQAGRRMVTGGIDGWRVVQKFVDDDSFDQDLMIEHIANFTDRVWFDIGSEKQDRSDAKWAFDLVAISMDEYKERFPDGSEQSVTTDRQNTAYFNQPDLILVGNFYWIKETERELVLMSNGSVYENDEDFKKVKKELAAKQVTVVNTRKRMKKTVFTRFFDNDGWLKPEQETVFSWIPLIPTYANFSIFENKILYHGVVQKMMDPQRVLNYAKSREIEEGALAPRAKYWMTLPQAAGHEHELQTMNTNADPVQFYNADPEAPGIPQQNGGAVINPGLITVSQSMQEMLTRAGGFVAADLGQMVNNQSGVALDKLDDKASTGNVKFFSAQEVAICHTARILLDAIPKVYETERQVRILKEDGSFDITMLNQTTIDQETGEAVTLNDLSMGTYDVTCSAGSSFKNRQQETVTAITEMAAVDPTIIQLGADVLLNNVVAPGMDLIAERKRAELFKAGLIPEDQWTDEERQQVQAQQEAAAQNPPPPDAGMVLAQAEMTKAENEKSQLAQDREIAIADLGLRDREMGLKEFEAQAKAQNAAEKVDLDQDKFDLQQVMSIQQQQMDLNSQVFKDIKTIAEGMKTIREASGVDAIVGPHIPEAFANSAIEITEIQEDAGFETLEDELEEDRTQQNKLL